MSGKDTQDLPSLVEPSDPDLASCPDSVRDYISALEHLVEHTTKERDEADRRAGAAERKRDQHSDELIRLRFWKERVLEAAGLRPLVDSADKVIPVIERLREGRPAGTVPYDKREFSIKREGGDECLRFYQYDEDGPGWQCTGTMIEDEDGIYCDECGERP